MYKVSTLKSRPSVVSRILLGELKPSVRIQEPDELLDLYHLGLEGRHVQLHFDDGVVRRIARCTDPDKVKVYCKYAEVRYEVIHHELSHEVAHELIHNYPDIHHGLAITQTGDILEELLQVCDFSVKKSAFGKITTSTNVCCSLLARTFNRLDQKEQVKLLLFLIEDVHRNHSSILTQPCREWLSKLALQPPPIGPLAALILPAAKSHDTLEYRIAKAVADNQTVRDFKSAETPVLVAAFASREPAGRKALALKELLRRFNIPDYLIKGVLTARFGAETLREVE